MSEPYTPEDLQSLEPVQEQTGQPQMGAWTRRLVFFLRVMAGLSMLKGLYHWSRVCGIGVGETEIFQNQSIAWQAARVRGFCGFYEQRSGNHHFGVCGAARCICHISQ